MTDEMTDDNGKFVLNILAVPLQLQNGKIKTFLLDTVFLDTTNHSTVAQAVVNCVGQYEISFNDIMIINTNNTAYMKKAYKAVFRTLFPNSVHITCLAHIMNMLGEDFKKPFKSVNKFVKDFNVIFWNAGARKARYLNFLAEARPGEKPKMAPNPIGTRWNCWYDSVKYHVKNMDVYKTFISAEMDHAKSLAPNSLKDLAALFEDELGLQALKSQMLFIIDKSDIFVQATDMFQSQSPMALTVWSMLEGLQCSFGAGGVSLTSADRFFGCEMDRATKLQLLDLFNQAFAFVSAKLDKYLSPDGQPGIDFLKEVQFFHPAKIKFAPAACDLTTIVGLKSVPQGEIEHYIKFLAPQALRHASPSVLDIEMFWNSAVEVVPGLAACARRYTYATISSADAERSFSLYNLILSQRWRSLNSESLRCLCFLYYNQLVGEDFFQ